MIEQLLAGIPTLLENDALIAVALFAGTAILVALWVPGVLMPLAASSAAMLDVWSATAVVVFGALVGSMIIFATTRRFAKGRVPPRIAVFLARFEARFRSRGAWFVLGLRLVGAPHFLVSASSALMPIKASSFALATFVGLIPAILLAAVAGSAIGT